MTRMRKSASSIPRASTSTSSDACSAKADSSPRSAAETSGRRRELFAQRSIINSTRMNFYLFAQMFRENGFVTHIAG
jgi:hypothetical protein